MSQPTLAAPDALDPCHACQAGRMGPWTLLTAVGAPVRLGDRILAGRHCDRCYGVELQARRAPDADPINRPPKGRSPGAALALGLAQNVVLALTELWELRPGGAGWGKLPPLGRKCRRSPASSPDGGAPVMLPALGDQQKPDPHQRMYRFILDDGPFGLRIAASLSPRSAVRWPVAVFEPCGEPSIDANRLAVAATCHRALSESFAGPDPDGMTYRNVCELAATHDWDDTGVILRLARYIDERGLGDDVGAFLSALGTREEAEESR